MHTGQQIQMLCMCKIQVSQNIYPAEHESLSLGLWAFINFRPQNSHVLGFIKIPYTNYGVKQ